MIIKFLTDTIFRIKRKINHLTVEKFDNYLELRSKNYAGLKLFSGHYRIRHRNSYGMCKEADLTNFIDNLPAKTVMWDVGANVGYFSLYAAKKGMKVLAFEPDQMTCGILNKNIFLNGLSNRVLAIPVALNDETKVSAFFMRDFKPANAYNTFDRKINEWGNNFSEDFTQGAFGIKGDDLILDETLRGYSNPGFVKIGVDGNEYKVLRGMTDVLKKVKFICIELGYSHSEFHSIQTLLSKLGFQEITDEEYFDEERHKNGMRNIYYQQTNF